MDNRILKDAKRSIMRALDTFATEEAIDTFISKDSYCIIDIRPSAIEITKTTPENLKQQIIYNLIPQESIRKLYDAGWDIVTCVYDKFDMCDECTTYLCDENCSDHCNMPDYRYILRLIVCNDNNEYAAISISFTSDAVPDDLFIKPINEFIANPKKKGIYVY